MADAGVVAESKHFILNEFETNRLGTSGRGSGSSGSSDLSYSVYISDKAFHETYLAPFYPVVKNGLGGMMCAMNRVNGTYSCESQVSAACFQLC